jgi:cyclohexanone monooxygenase
VPAHNGPIDPDLVRRVKADYAGFRALSNAERGAAQFNVNQVSALAVDTVERRRVYDARWARGGLPFLASFADLILDARANATAAEYVHAKIREVVKDPTVAERLCPTQTFACKRLCVDSGYYETFNRLNVTLVDVRAEPIEEITARGLRTRGGEYVLDSLVFATGFDAMTGALFAIDIRGRGGASLRDAWAAGPRTYLGVSSVGFPNLFLVSGPGSPSVLSNMVASIEQHVEWISDLIEHANRTGCTRVEPSEAAQNTWVEHVNEVAGATLYPTCNSWYVGANVPGKPRLFMPYAGGFPSYRARCLDVASRGYEGFAMSGRTRVNSEVGA